MDTGEPTIRNGLVAFREAFFETDSGWKREKHFSNPMKNAAAKRLNMFLRWMVRRDNMGVDFGIWEDIKPAWLLCPLDVHTGRVARALGLLERREDDWKAVVELTERLKTMDGEDPVKYDFALFGLGVFEGFGS